LADNGVFDAIHPAKTEPDEEAPSRGGDFRESNGSQAEISNS
jgi:hypothetical protein